MILPDDTHLIIRLELMKMTDNQSSIVDRFLIGEIRFH